MKTIFGFIALCIVSVSLLVWLLVLGFQTQSLGDVFTINGTFFGHWSTYEVLLAVVLPLASLMPFIVIALSVIIKSEDMH